MEGETNMKKLNRDEVFTIGFAVGSVVLAGAVVAADYMTSKWKCSKCGHTFKAPFAEYALAMHTPTRRKLSCPSCDTKGYFKCVRKV